jgi:uncharacterized RDD family membrane protein YckC
MSRDAEIKTRKDHDAPAHGEVPAPTATLLRRLGALLYDALLLSGLLLLATAVFIIPYDLLAARPYPHSELLYRTLLQIYLLVVIAGFFVYFWTHGGQTLGMRTWRLRVIRDDGASLNSRDALRRLVWATLSLLPAGLGLWWSLFDHDHLAWHDRRSRTRLVMVI